MTLKVVWGISGSGDKMPETVVAMAEVRRRLDLEITAAVSIAGVRVLRWYKLTETVEEIAKSVKIEKDANSPFITGPLQIGQYDCLLVAPATANSVAKIAHGIEDTMLTNAVGQTAKSSTPIYIMPVDLRPGTTVTMRPGGERLEPQDPRDRRGEHEQAAHDGGHHRVRITFRDRGHPPRLRGAAGRDLLRVSVDTGCRLHLGFTNLSDDVGRCFGSLGVALDRPSTTVVLDDAREGGVVGDDAEHIRACLQLFCDHYQVDPLVSIEVRESIPRHVGLGSGTQLALAIGIGLATVCGIDADVRDVAAVMGRGRRSGAGIAAFHAGGFTIDAGTRKGQTGLGAAPTVVWRRDFPADWRFVVVIPDADRGLSGRMEEGVFCALSPSVRISEEVCRIIQLRLMPALVEHDIDEFGRALTAVDRKTGAYFSEVQGGVYGGGETNAAIDALLTAGARGAGQSFLGAGGLRSGARAGRGRGRGRGPRPSREEGRGSTGDREPGPQYRSASRSAEGGSMKTRRGLSATLPVRSRSPIPARPCVPHGSSR